MNMNNLTTQEKETLFQTHLPTAEKIAKHFCARYQKPLEETRNNALFALCLLIYDETRNCFDPSKGTLEQWLGIKIHYHLMEIYSRGKHPQNTEFHEPAAFKEQTGVLHQWACGEIPAPPSASTGKSWLKLFLEDLTEESQALLQVILDAPEDLWMEIKPTPGLSQNTKQTRLYKYMVDVLDWSPGMVSDALSAIKKSLQIAI